MDKQDLVKNICQGLLSVVVGTLFCMLAVLLFAFVVKIAELPSEIISPVTRVVKCMGIFTGVMVAISGKGSLLKGLISGMGMVLVTYVVFSMIAGSFVWELTDWLEILFGAIIGGVSGGVCAVVKK